MKLKMQLLTIFLIGNTVGWSLSTIYFKEMRESFKPTRERHRPRKDAFKKLGLERQTIEKIREYHNEGRNEFQRLQTQQRKKKDYFNHLIETTKNQDKLREAFAELIKVKAETDWAHYKVMQSVHSLLTLEQIKEFRKKGPPAKRSHGREDHNRRHHHE